MNSVTATQLGIRRPLQAARFLELAMLVVGLGILCFHVLPRAWVRLNTDFPNDYVAARLVREGYTVDRIYEWEWFEEQKERMGVTQPMAGFIPHTPFSVIPMLPFTWLDPLPAKRAWIIFTLVLLGGSIAFIADISRVPRQWIASAALLSLPLYRNLEYGQYYVLLLFLLSAALWCTQRNHRVSAGVLIALAAGLKIFPVILLFFYLRKRDFRALLGFFIGAATATALSLACFGTTACVRFLNEILPSALHGEAMNPFAIPASSISTLVRHLFVFHPQMNSHPIANTPRVVGILVPLLQMLVLAPAILACSRSGDKQRDAIEWSSILTASLAISSLPASYNFIVLLLPCAVLFRVLHRKERHLQAWMCAALYMLIGWAISPSSDLAGFSAILAVPRLWLLLLLCGVFYVALADRGMLHLRRELLWVAGLGLLTALQIVGFVRHQDHLYDSNTFLDTTGTKTFVVASPRREARQICFHGMTAAGWRWAELDQDNRVSIVQSCATDSAWEVEEKGRHSLWVRNPDSQMSALVSGDLDVYDYSAAPGSSVVFSAMARDHSIHLYMADTGRPPQDLGISNARFPAISPDQRWLAYSSLKKGFWHLTIRNLKDGTDDLLRAVDCNDASPVWSQDSRTLIYVSDCGRGLWQTAFAPFARFQ